MWNTVGIIYEIPHHWKVQVHKQKIRFIIAIMYLKRQRISVGQYFVHRVFPMAL